MNAERKKRWKRRAMGAGLGLAAMRMAGPVLGLSTLGISAATRRFSRLHPLRVIRAAGELHPELKGTTRILRNVAAGPAALSEKIARAGRTGNNARSQVNLVLSSEGRRGTAAIARGSKRRNLVLIARRPLWTKKIGHLGGGPALAHELGHLADKGRRASPLGSNASFARLREEWRATSHGAKIHRKAGGNRALYWGTMLPAFGSYATRNPAVMAGGAAFGAWRGGRRRRTKK